jgi:hypothetical protein
MYTPKVIPAVLGAAIAPVVATTLPQAGVSLVNDVALSLAAALVVWALAYLKLRKTS